MPLPQEGTVGSNFKGPVTWNPILLQQGDELIFEGDLLVMLFLSADVAPDLMVPASGHSAT
jgi:hypothetical protein